MHLKDAEEILLKEGKGEWEYGYEEFSFAQASHAGNGRI